VTISPFQLDSYRYIFINESVDTLSNNKMFRDLFKEGLRYRLVDCVGSPRDKIAYYENSQQGFAISNITALFDTMVFDADNHTLQHPIQMVYLDMYLRM